mgnify:CR=1 FL=1
MRNMRLSPVFTLPQTTDLLMDLIGDRDDGVSFCVRIHVTEDEMNATDRPDIPVRSIVRLVATKMTVALMSMDEYDNCSCQVNMPCDKHKSTYNPFA